MTTTITEWEFTAQVKGWIDKIISHDPGLPFSEARCEQRGTDSQKRRDLTLLDKSGQIVLTGEVKLPYRKDGNTPYRNEVVADARTKAKKARCAYFFTWNVNECVLWETLNTGLGLPGQTFQRWSVVTIAREEHLTQSPTEEAIYRWLVVFLNDFARILHGQIKIGRRSPDEKFVEALESALALPIRHTQDELFKRYPTKSFKRDLDAWMRELGWIILDDEAGVRENLERAAKFSCYLLVNKLVFHEALLKKYGRALDPLSAPPEIDTGEQLRHRLEMFFADARKITGDYETIFGEGPSVLANRIPFYSDLAVGPWRGLIEQIHEFDFSKLDYEVVGGIFERLIGPEERHKYGQFYTRVEVVDLINSFCIRTGDAVVMDPACGGGTFLVRAYGRKRELSGSGRKHRELLTDIYGIDVSQFAAHLTTMNLATRDLVEDENYPRVGRDDFFNVLPNTPFVQLPQKLVSKGLGKNTLFPISIPPLDAVIANPPYVRQEDIRKAAKKAKDGGPEQGTKEFYQKRVKQMAGAILSGRSDLHCYFWPHAAQFLKSDGMLGFITSSQWLDVEYGFHLQRWLLSNFKIIAILESPVEPWFVGARVSTTVTIAQRCLNEADRMANNVRFVQLRRPLGEIFDHDGTMAGAMEATDRLRGEILGLEKSVADRRYRARIIGQGDLWKQGVELGKIVSKSRVTENGDEDSDDEEQSTTKGYYGGKWGIFLRAPDLWFDLLDQYGTKFAPLGELADVRFGVKSGKDVFFFPKDCSSDCLKALAEPHAFELEYGVPRKVVASGEVKLVQCGEGKTEIAPIEAKYLEPEVHSLMEISKFSVGPADCSRYIVLLPSNPSLEKYARRYVKWGESKGFHKTPTCEARETADRRWFDLTYLPRPDIILPKIQQYRLATFLNEQKLYQNSSLLGLYDFPEQKILACTGVLNSTIAILSRVQYARILGNEGNIQLDVYSAKMMVVPNILTFGRISKVEAAFKKMLLRPMLSFIPEQRMRRMAFQNAGKETELAALSDICELDMLDRRELDHAVLELLGMKSERERTEWINHLYDYLRAFFEQVRDKEEHAIANKNTTNRKGLATPQDIAAQVWREISENEGHWLRPYREFVWDIIGRGPGFDVRDLPADGEAHLHEDMTGIGVMFVKGRKHVALVTAPTLAEARLLVLIASEGMRGPVKVPRKEAEIERVIEHFGTFARERDVRVRGLIAERSSDEDLQTKVYELVIDRLRQHSN